MSSDSVPIPGAMDVVRPRRRGVPRVVIAIVTLAIVAAGVAWALGTLRSMRQVTTVDRATLVTDRVRRETLVREVDATGSFAAEYVRVAAATQDGTVDHVLVRPGSAVAAGDVIAVLSNPALEEHEADARSAITVAEANVASAAQQRAASQLTLRGALADAKLQAKQNEYDASTMRALLQQGLVSQSAYRKAEFEAERTRNSVAVSAAQIGVGAADSDAKIAALRAQLADAVAREAGARADIASLTVRAAAPGVVQSVAVDPGARVMQGAELARIADVRTLKAVLQIPEGSVHDVAPGMRVRVQTAGTAVTGSVMRIAPLAQNGSVGVDVTFAHALPPGTRPDATVTGAIELSRTPNALTLARPAGAADGTTIDLFKVVDGGARAVRVHVRLAGGSADRVGVASGLQAGDVAIVSDMSSYADHTEIRIR